MAKMKGTVHMPNAATERVLAVIVALGAEEFTAADIAARIPDLSVPQVRAVLSRKCAQGGLQRTGRDRYRRRGPLRTTLPQSSVAEAIWAALFTAPRDTPLQSGDITGEAESYLGRPDVSLQRNVASTLNTWTRQGFLQRTGRRGQYAYRVAPGVTERPVYNPNI